MHVFYTPDIQKSNELPEEEAQHCTRVLRLGIGDEITLTDGKGHFMEQVVLHPEYQEQMLPTHPMMQKD